MRPYVRKAQRLPPGTPRLAHPRSRRGVRVFDAATRLAASPLATWAAERISVLTTRADDVPDDLAFGA
jgi:hypothetical protein